ncbi:DUF3768 domain-containing protein [Roseomonas hellenica]|uniref:DUF3768 domain-containing protein n=1 Tax=Plastoroseomonas hellenica TaxID=2687306 RepID=A0ABS5EUN1_9PROT|nr:DUF3768 domain-containing protein [Plastoroseomonas hellenica]MBR0664011.1 DUF3768 domain-containing protein [Plastoroseomonas hellenica]
MSQADQAARIRELNDQLRINGIGGTILLTAGVQALSARLRDEVLAQVQQFAAFGRGNDPHGEHDFAIIEVLGERVIFKIDYYDRSLTAHSIDPADPTVTHRVLTIMMAGEC